MARKLKMNLRTRVVERSRNTAKSGIMPMNQNSDDTTK